jgi:predicted aldo/keto reductase-like oxidoreductase
MGEDDLAKIEASHGVLNALYRMRDEKLTRFVGITCHNDPVVLKTALERHDFDCVQMALNAAKQGMKGGQHGMVRNPAIQTSFEHVALPVARQKNLGILAMKIMGQDHLVCRHARHGGCQFARNFAPMPEEEMQDFSHRMAEPIGWPSI